MEDPNQIEVPPSFLALYASPSGLRLTEPLSHVRQRYELCEDMAQLLSEQASAAAFRSGAPEADVLAGFRAALAQGEAPLPEAEALWVVRRIAELLGWPLPEF